MKKVFLLATAAFLVTGFAFAHEGDGKKCVKGKDGKDCCAKKETKATKSTTAKAAKAAKTTTKA
ncbi:MAG: hypothetical protein JWQ78_26 [Sediminibacterium sp.]|nr:hypothetical protein [Sediminibacterium sp.]